MKSKSTVDFADKTKYYTGRENIITFFLNIYKIQTGSMNLEPSKYELLNTDRQRSSDDTYDLHAAHNGRWSSRRMSIGPLGDGSGSKSMCFKVIFDDILVVKVPPSPIADFGQYIEGIAGERGIAERLSPNIECIAPDLSALLKKIPPFSDYYDVPHDELENICLNHLKKNSGYQNYLKIGNTFAFFMNLSKHTFLSQVIEKLHDMRDAVRKEIISHGDIISDMMLFDERFGAEYDMVFWGISEAFTKYEESVKTLLTQHGMNYSVPAFKIKEWFLIHLSDSRLDPLAEEQPQDFVSDMNDLFKRLLKKYVEEIKSYRHMVEDYINRMTFSRNRILYGGMITNMLVLLYWLREKGVSIRDLKPDNMFVVGDVIQNPLLLASPRDYSIGLIDFETAVYFKKTNPSEISQPMLAGTPSYATPSHLFTNDLIISSLNDLPRILHLQDWQAMVGMFFYIVTGERLFDRTRRKLSEIRSIIKTSTTQNKSMSEAFRISSHNFWKSATQEFNEKVEAYAVKLKAVEIFLLKYVRDMLKEETLREKSKIVDNMKKQVISQPFFKSDKSRQSLLRASSEMICKTKLNWVNSIGVPPTKPIIRNRIIRVLQNLENTKNEYEKQLRYLKILDMEAPKMTVYDIINLMFSAVSHSMYSEDWESLVTDMARNMVRKEKPKPIEEEISTMEAVAFEKTVDYGSLF